MQPLDSSTSSSGIHAVTGDVVLSTGQYGASWCQLLIPPCFGGLNWIWSCQTCTTGEPVSWLIAWVTAGLYSSRSNAGEASQMLTICQTANALSRERLAICTGLG